MVKHDETTRISRRSVLRATGVAGIGFAGIGLAGAGVGASRNDSDAQADSESQADSAGHAESGAQSDPFEGYACGAGHAEGNTFSVTPRCGDDCDVIRATGLTPDCAGSDEDLYVDLHGTDPTVWVAPSDRRTGAIRPGTYRVVGAEECGGDAPACGGDELYRVRFRATGGN